VAKFKPCASKIRIKSAKATNVKDVHEFSSENFLMLEMYSPATTRRYTDRTNECVVIQNQLIVTPLLTPSFPTCSRVKILWHLMTLKKCHAFTVLGFTYITCIAACDVSLQRFLLLYTQHFLS